MARTPKVVEDRREQIIDAAMRVFAQKGFLRATNKDIAREAGITPGLIYYYFESKEAVLKAIIETRTPLQVISSMPPDAFAIPPEQFLRMLLQRVVDVVEGEDFIGLLRVMLPELIHNPALLPLPLGAFERILGFLNGYFDAQVKAGAMRSMDVSLAVQTLVGSMMGFVLRRQILQDPSALAYSHEQIVDAIVDIVLNGVKPR